MSRVGGVLGSVGRRGVEVKRFLDRQHGGGLVNGGTGGSDRSVVKDGGL